MNILNPTHSENRRILSTPALIICSDEVSRDGPPTLVKREGLRVIPPNSTLNPKALDGCCHPEQSAIPGELEIAYSLRGAACVSELADRAIRERRAEARGSTLVADRRPAIEYRHFF